MFDRKAYMRDYMRKRRNSQPLTRRAPSWIAVLRARYAAFLRAQSAVSAFQSDALRHEGDPSAEPPEHLRDALAEALAALDAHEAQHPELAREYYQRHEADQLRKAADRLERKLAKPTRPRGRPVDLPGRLAAAVLHAQAASAARAAAYADHQRAQGDPSLPPDEATRLQNRWDTAKRRDEEAHAAAEALQRQHDEAAAAQAAHDAAQADDRATLTALREQIAQILAPLPDPPLAPLHESRLDRKPARRRKPASVPLTAERLAALTVHFCAVRNPDGSAFLARRATERRVRTATVRVPGSTDTVRALDLLDALAPSGLV